MNPNKIKSIIKDNIDIEHRFFYRGYRNQCEEFTGKIIKCYHSVFLIKLFDGSVKSFSYSDFGINNIKIIS